MPDEWTAPPTPAVPKSHGRLWEFGTLYTAVAGMLNLLAILDSAYRAGQLQIHASNASRNAAADVTETAAVGAGSA